MTDALELLKTRRSLKPVELVRPGPVRGRDRYAADRRLAGSRSRQARAMALHRIRRRSPPRRRRRHRSSLPRQVSRRQARADRIRTEAPGARAARHRGGEPRRPARENSGMGAGALGRRRRHESCARRPRARLRRQLDHRMVRLRPARARCARIWPSTSAWPGFIHIGRPAHPAEDRPRPPLDAIATRFESH